MNPLIAWVLTVMFGGLAFFFAIGTVGNALDVPKGDNNSVGATLFFWVLTGLSLAATLFFWGHTS